ncbi:MAG: tetratricopeptide repeat protein [Bacteroidia bacterium]|nr:tetratricopeptide repeat protein [Bacteroidia bacterium]MDW8236158.1 tetratricopeptide repeat protein [Bacteroidia bacterium]
MSITVDIERQRQLVDELNSQAYEERYNNTQLALRLAQDALTKARDIGYTEGQAWAMRNIGIAHAISGHNEEAVKYLYEAYVLFERMENMRGLGLSLSNLGTLYQQIGEMDKAIEYLSRSLRYLQLIPDLAFFYAQTLANLGSLFGELEQYELALEYQEKALELHRKLSNVRGIFFSTLSIASFYQALKRYEEAEKYLVQAMDTAADLGEENLVIRVLLAQAELLNETGQVRDALARLERAEYLASAIQNPSLMIQIELAMANTYLALNFVDKSEEAVKKVESLATQVKGVAMDYYLSDIKARIAEKKKDYEHAFHYYRDYAQRRLALQRAATRNTLTTLERILREDLLGARHEAPPELVVAKRIQEILLHGEEELKQVFPDSIEWLVPKGHVSGDFLWVAKGKDSSQVLVVADASGAGVSAAILSTIAHTLLYEIVTIRGVTDPGRILTQVHKALLDLLYPTAKKSSPEIEAIQAEGLQMGVCTVLSGQGELHYAGALLPLWVYNPLLGWEQLTPDRRLIGQKAEDEKSMRVYTSTIIPLEKQWVLVFMTDGWERQIKASSGKRYGRSAVRDFLNANPPKDLKEWIKLVQKEFDEWREGAAPTDDVLIVAVRT